MRVRQIHLIGGKDVFAYEYNQFFSIYQPEVGEPWQIIHTASGQWVRRGIDFCSDAEILCRYFCQIDLDWSNASFADMFRGMKSKKFERVSKQLGYDPWAMSRGPIVADTAVGDGYVKTDPGIPKDMAAGPKIDKRMEDITKKFFDWKYFSTPIKVPGSPREWTCQYHIDRARKPTKSD